MTTDVLVVRKADGSLELVSAKAASCRSCGFCGVRADVGADFQLHAHAPLRVSLPSRSLLLMAIAMYGAPFAGLLLGALLAARLETGDFVAALISFGGCLLAAVTVGRMTRDLERQAIESIGGMSPDRDRSLPQASSRVLPARISRC